MKVQTTRLSPIYRLSSIYRDVKNFNETAFLKDVKLKNSSLKSDDSNESFIPVSIFQSVVNKHAPLKTKIVQGNNAPYVNKFIREVP